MVIVAISFQLPGAGAEGKDAGVAAGSPAVTLAVTKLPGENAVGVAKEVLRRLDQLKGSVIPEGVNVVVTDGTKLVITGADRHMVGQVASSIKLYKPVEPYKGKGVRVEGEYVRRKEGKKTA